MWILQRSSGWRVLLVAALVFGSLPAGATAVRAAGPDSGDASASPSPAGEERPAGRLGAAPVLDTASPAASDPQVSPRVQAVEAVTNSIDTSSREAVTQAYNQQYLANRGAAQGWTGSVSNCQRGTVNAGYIAAVTGMVNYFRGMTGLPGVSMASSLNSLDQAAALIMDANDTLTHGPTSGMDCYTQDGYDGASHSNICLGCIGPSAIDAYMYDSGSGNTAVGHRRWILYPPQTLLGTGSTTQADALYVLHTSSWSRPADAPTWISWPPKGFVPYSQVYPRFSLTRQGAGFGAATVQVKVGGAPVAATIVSRNGGYGDPALVFEVNVGSLGLAGGDRVFEVTVNGIDVGGSTVSHSWQTTSFVPGVASPSGVAATGISNSQVRVTWKDVIGEDGYRIRRDDGSPTWPVVGTAGANGTSFTDAAASRPRPPTPTRSVPTRGRPRRAPRRRPGPRSRWASCCPSPWWSTTGTPGSPRAGTVGGGRRWGIATGATGHRFARRRQGRRPRGRRTCAPRAGMPCGCGSPRSMRPPAALSTASPPSMAPGPGRSASGHVQARGRCWAPTPSAPSRVSGCRIARASAPRPAAPSSSTRSRSCRQPRSARILQQPRKPAARLGMLASLRGTDLDGRT